MAQTFLASANLSWLDWLQGAPEHTSEGEAAHAEELQVLRAVHKKRYTEAIQLVESLKVPVCRRLSKVGCYGEKGPSLLHISMESCMQPPAIGDVELLLRVAKLRDEVLCEEDFAAACASGERQIIVLLRDAGAPMCRDALHHALGAGDFMGQTDVIASAQLLLEARASINGLSERGNSPLTTAILHSTALDKEPLIGWLLQQKADATGSGGSRLPLHSCISSLTLHGSNCFATLLRHRAEVNSKAPLCGSTPLHLAVYPRIAVNLRLVHALKALGADCRLRDDEGRTAAEMLFDAGMPEAAAELEGRAMNAAEEEYCRARQHPVAKAFARSGFGREGWSLDEPVAEAGACFARKRRQKIRAFLEKRLSSLLGGHSPETVVITLPLTRGQELNEDVELSAPRPEGFFARELLEGVYKWYQEPLSTAQLSRVQKYHDTGCFWDIGDVSLPDEECTEQEQRKKRAVPRINLRVGGRFFEGFGKCAYFEEQRKLTARISLGS